MKQNACGSRQRQFCKAKARLNAQAKKKIKIFYSLLPIVKQCPDPSREAGFNMHSSCCRT